MQITSTEIHGVTHIEIAFVGINVKATNVNFKTALIAAYAKLLNEMSKDL